MHIDTGDTAWVLVSSSLVMLMTPAIGLFYGGMVEKKNLLSTIMLSFVSLLVITVQWVLVGYSLSFGPDFHSLIGGLQWCGPAIAPISTYAPTIPHLAYMMFQMKFAIITPALITGAFVDRVKFQAFVLFTLLWTTFVYDPVAHWVWGDGGWLRSLGSIDFAGGTVVHITAGVAALALSIALRNKPRVVDGRLTPYSVPLTLFGAVLLWFGWFGFNGGSALGANGTAAQALITTNIAAAGRSPYLDGSEYHGRFAIGGRNSDRSSSRARSHHAGLRLCRCILFRPYRCNWFARRVWFDKTGRKIAHSRFPRRLCLSWYGRNVGRDCDRHFRFAFDQLISS